MAKVKSNKNIKLTFIGLVILLAFGILAYVHASDVRTFLFGRTVNPFTIKTSSKHIVAIGIPAIMPSTSATATSSSTFTLDDAKIYINSHPFHDGKTTTGQPSSIESIYFATDEEVKDLTKGQDPGLSPTSQVLFVIEKGPFLLDNMIWPKGEPIPSAQEVYRVFDAHTGNLLMWGQWR